MIMMDRENQSSSAVAQNFKFPNFEGPLDLLLYMIKKSEINIYDIPISKIVEQYLDYLKYAESINLDNLSEFYVMASTLLYIKSKMLLPVEINIDDEFEDPRQELVERLIEYQKFKKISDLISDREKEAEWMIRRSSKERTFAFANETSMLVEIDVWDLFQTFSAILTSMPSEQMINLYEEVSVNEKVTLIKELIEKEEEVHFTELIKEASVMSLICAFLALLDSVKNKIISVFQNRMFGDIVIKKYCHAAYRPEESSPDNGIG